MRILSEPWLEGRLIRRYKRFLADVALPDGTEVTVHCPNTGAMTNCFKEGDQVFLSETRDTKRKTRFTWELSRHGAYWIGINSAKANALIGEALDKRRLAGFESVQEIKSEQRFLDSRMDFKLAFQGQPDMVMEVKSVTYRVRGNLGLFPDAPSLRAIKHLDALIEARRQGLQAALIFCAQHSGIDRIAPAVEIAPDYGAKLQAAAAVGVKIHGFKVGYQLPYAQIKRALPVEVAIKEDWQ
ncbi:MAG: DNA/RNA nuclease SfsA [Proteobacteria bacterium]|nr:DNA/RNA nuclease SfsA [Pseudomonadota bacterium]